MKLRDKLQQEIKRNIESQVHSTKGVILEYSHKTNKATVKVRNPFKEGVLTYCDLQVPPPGTGITNAGPYRGDLVMIQFTNSDLRNPKITSLVDDNYYTNNREELQKHENQGAYVPDGIKEKEDLVLTPRTVFDDFYIEKADRKSLKSPEVTKELLEDESKYGLSEIGLTHPKNKSTIKIKDDGNIDIFSWLNQGIRINPVKKLVMLLSNRIRLLAVSKIELLSEKDIEVKGQRVYIEGEVFINEKSIKDYIREVVKEGLDE